MTLLSRLTLVNFLYGLMQSFAFGNNGPIVKVNGSPNRTVWFEVEDENGRMVSRVPADSQLESYQ